MLVTYNSGKVIAPCLRSLREIRERGGTVTVIDNASQDETSEQVRQFDWVHLVENEGNRGFAGGSNQGARMGSGRYILLLNPDTILLTPDLGALEIACEEHGLASGMLVGNDGRAQVGFFARRLPTPGALCFEALGLNRVWPSNPINRKYRCLDLTGGQADFVEQPPGAFVMVRRDVWEQLGGMDESFYPVWFEDTDLCKRALASGYRIRFSPDCQVRHEGGHSVLQVDEDARGLLWYGSLLRYAEKHFSPMWYGGVCTAVAGGAMARALLTILRSSGRGSLDRAKTVRMYGTIMRLAVQSLLVGKVPPAQAAVSGGR